MKHYDITPYCVNCAHYRARLIRGAQCTHPLNSSVVDGTPVFSPLLLRAAKDPEVGRCGRQAKWFKPKQGARS